MIKPAFLLRAAALMALASTVLLGGCMSFIPAYQRPAAPVPTAYAPELAASGAAGSLAADIDWQQYFADARLRRLIAIALANNRDLRVAALNIEQTRAAYQIRKADELPTLGVGASAQRVAGASGSLIRSYAVGAQMTAYELDFFGRVRSLSQAALAQYLATVEARQTVQIALVASVANAYVNLLADAELLRVTGDTLQTREASFKLVELKFENGAASELDRSQAAQLLEGARVSLAQTTRQRALDENALVLLLGQALPADAGPAVPLSARQTLVDLPAGLPSDLLERRPDVRAAEQQLIAANANIGAARAAFFPRISLTANAGTASTDLGRLFASGTFALTGGATLLQPLFDAGRNQANLEVARINREIALAQYEKAIQTAVREVSDALAGRATLTEQLRAQVAQARAAQTSFKLAELRYRQGASSYLDVLDAQRALFASEQASVQVQTLQVQNLLTLYKVLGGGWTSTPATN